MIKKYIYNYIPTPFDSITLLNTNIL